MSAFVFVLRPRTHATETHGLNGLSKKFSWFLRRNVTVALDTFLPPRHFLSCAYINYCMGSMLEVNKLACCGPVRGWYEGVLGVHFLFLLLLFLYINRNISQDVTNCFFGGEGGRGGGGTIERLVSALRITQLRV